MEPQSGKNKVVSLLSLQEKKKLKQLKLILLELCGLVCSFPTS